MNKFISHFFHHIIIFVMKRLFILLLIILPCVSGFTQIRNDVPRYNPDSVREELDKRPYFRYTKTTTLSGVRPSGANRPIKIPM